MMRMFWTGWLMLVLSLVPLSAHAGDSKTIEEIIEDEGVFSFTDGSSLYHLEKDGKFLLEPAGNSGRTISGFWTTEDGRRFVVVGLWGWINGRSLDHDYRRLELSVIYHGKDATQAGMHDTKVYGVYFTVEALETVAEDVWQKASAK